MVSRRNGDRGWHVQACWHVPCRAACLRLFLCIVGRTFLGTENEAPRVVSGSSPSERVMLQNAVIGPLQVSPSQQHQFAFSPVSPDIWHYDCMCSTGRLGQAPLSASKHSDAGSGLILPLLLRPSPHVGVAVHWSGRREDGPLLAIVIRGPRKAGKAAVPRKSRRFPSVARCRGGSTPRRPSTPSMMKFSRRPTFDIRDGNHRWRSIAAPRGDSPGSGVESGVGTRSSEPAPS